MSVVTAAVAVIALVAAAAVRHEQSSARPAGAEPTSRRLAPTTMIAPTSTTTSAVTTTTLPPLAAPYSRAVQIENTLPGTDAWRITGVQQPGAIEGYADRVSARQGDTVRLFVSTSAPTFRIEAYRLGWYGGHVGRLVWRSAPQHGALRAPPSVDATTHMVEASWPDPLALRLTTRWFPGDYLLKLVGSGGEQSYVPLTVRDDHSRASILVVNAVATWQAYNDWGGNSLYTGVSRSGYHGFSYRARVVSFDRPYAEGSGAGDFLGNELPFVVLAERLGLDLTYETDVDLEARPASASAHRLMVSLGHDEYWSVNMRSAAEHARDHGTSLLFLGANAVYRRIRYASSPLGPDRFEIAYKSAGEDPVRATDPENVTVNWRDAPDPRPESTLLGEQYECNTVHASMVIAQPDSWIFTGTGLRRGDRLQMTVGPEYDRYSSNEAMPPGVDHVDVVAHSPVVCRGRQSYADATTYVAPSGATVFDSGTNWWVSKLVFGCPQGEQPCVADAVRRVTANLLLRLGAGPHAPVPVMPASFPLPAP